MGGRGGRGGGRLPTLPCRNPAGGLPFWSPSCPFTLACFSAPIPPTPFPAGRGRLIVFLCKGLRPLHPRGLTRAARAFLVESGTQGGGACLFGRPLPLPLACFSAPHPPSPLPLRGRGSFKVYFAGGYRPRHPCNRVGSGTGFSCGKWIPLVITAVHGIQSLAGLDAALVSNGGSQGEGGPGEMELSVASDGGV